MSSKLNITIIEVPTQRCPKWKPSFVGSDTNDHTHSILPPIRRSPLQLARAPAQGLLVVLLVFRIEKSVPLACLYVLVRSYFVLTGDFRERKKSKVRFIYKLYNYE